MTEFDEYLCAKEPDTREKAYAWKTAIGLQKVDGLTPSEYLVTTAKRIIAALKIKAGLIRDGSRKSGVWRFQQ